MSFGMVVAFMMFIKELRRNGGETAANAILQVSNAEMFGYFFERKNKMASNDSDMPNSARNVKNSAADVGFQW